MKNHRFFINHGLIKRGESSMSGHSKWAGIKHRKGAQDAKKGKAFTKIVKEICVAARQSGGDPNTNPALRLAIQRAKGVNMPADNIERAIKKGTGELEGVTYEHVTYEGYGPGGVAIMVEALTDNKNRTTSEVRNTFSKKGGNMAGTGSVSWMFEKKAYFLINKSTIDEDSLTAIALDAGADDLTQEGDSYEIKTQPHDFEKVKKILEDKGVKLDLSDVTMVPKSTIRITGEKAKTVLGLMETLEEHDDVQHVYANFDIPDEDLKKI